MDATFKSARELKIGDQIIDQEGLEWTVEKIERVPANGKLEIEFHNPHLMISWTRGRFRPAAKFQMGGSYASK